jgi:transcription initiation factor TFIIH subunit 2
MLSDKRKLEPSGEPSLQNGLVMAKGGMRYVVGLPRIQYYR